MHSDARRISRSGKPRWLTGARQSMRSWAKAVESYDEVPDLYKGFFDALPHCDGAFPYAVLTPKYEGFLRREQEKLVCCQDSNLYVLQNKGSQLKPIAFRLRDIHYVDVGSFLLQSWLNIRGITSDGILTVTLKFNTVSEHLFGPILNKVRGSTLQPAGTDLNAERAKLSEIAGLSLKLLNLGKGSIQPGERLAGVLWQPEIQAQWLSLFGRPLSRTISPAHLSILTDREVILIRDNPSKDSKYGATRTFVPLAKIASVSLDEKKDGLLVTSLHLPENDRLDLLYSASNGAKVERVLEQLRTAALLK